VRITILIFEAGDGLLPLRAAILTWAVERVQSKLQCVTFNDNQLGQDQECTLSASQLARFEKYILAAANILRTRKADGKLLLDLDLDDYFRPGASSSPTPSL